MFNTGSISHLNDSGLRGNRQWVPRGLYSGHVLTVLEDGGIEVVINKRVYQALAHKSAQPGDLLSLRLLGTEPEPHFEIVGVLRRAAAQQEEGVQVRASWQEAVAMLRQLNPGLSALAALWQRYPEQLGHLSAKLPALMTSLFEKALPGGDVGKSERLRRQVLNSGLFFEGRAEEEAPDDLKPLLFRLLGALNGNRQLVLEYGRPVFTDGAGNKAQSLQDRNVALYTSQMEEGSQGSTLKQLLTLNVESALQQIVAGQLASLVRSDDKLSIWIMQLMISHRQQLVPVDMEIRRQMNTFMQEQWGVAFSLELPRSGRIHVTLAVKKPSVSIRLQCEHPELGGMLQHNGMHLKQAYEKTGLLLEGLQCADNEAA